MLETSTLQKAMDLSRATIPSLDLQQKNRKTTSQEEANSPLLGPQIRIANNSSI
jgi:hypothetical protein